MKKIILFSVFILVSLLSHSQDQKDVKLRGKVLIIAGGDTIPLYVQNDSTWFGYTSSNYVFAKRGTIIQIIHNPPSPTFKYRSDFINTNFYFNDSISLGDTTKVNLTHKIQGKGDVEFVDGSRFLNISGDFLGSQSASVLGVNYSPNYYLSGVVGSSCIVGWLTNTMSQANFFLADSLKLRLQKKNGNYLRYVSLNDTAFTWYKSYNNGSSVINLFSVDTVGEAYLKGGLEWGGSRTITRDTTVIVSADSLLVCYERPQELLRAPSLGKGSYIIRPIIITVRYDFNTIPYKSDAELEFILGNDTIYRLSSVGLFTATSRKIAYASQVTRSFSIDSGSLKLGASTPLTDGNSPIRVYIKYDLLKP